MNPTSSRCSFGLKQRIDFQNVIKNMAKDIINKEEFAFWESLKRIVRSARGMAYASINYAQVQANCLLG